MLSLCEQGEAVTHSLIIRQIKRKQRPREVKGLTQGHTAVRDRAADFLNLVHADLWDSRTNPSAASRFSKSEAWMWDAYVCVPGPSGLHGLGTVPGTRCALIKRIIIVISV